MMFILRKRKWPRL